MPFDGNGRFELPFDWEADRNAGFPTNRILAERMQDAFEDVARGLEDTGSQAYARLTGTSTSSVAIGTGSKSFTTQAGKAFDVGRWVLIASDANGANYMHGRVTAYSGTSLTVNVTNIGGSGTLADWTITLSGTQGTTGSTGATGGPAESFIFDASSTADSDPGSGKFRLNHATPASATAAYVDNNNAGGSDISAWLDTFDDGGKSADRGLLHVYVRATPGTNYRIYRVTGTVTDGTGYRKLVLVHVNGAGSLSASDVLDVKFVPRGADGSGTGDVVGPSSSVAGNIAVFDGTTGKLLQDGGVSLGIISAAIAAKADAATTLTAGSGLTGGGDLSSNRSFAVGAGAGITVNADDVAVSDNQRTATITFVIDGNGSAITTGVKGDLEIPFACTINQWTLVADQSGSIAIDIWRDSYANYPPTVADTITAAAKPTISAATKGQSSTLTGWSTSVSAGDTLRFNVDSITTVTRVTLSLKVTKT